MEYKMQSSEKEMMQERETIDGTFFFNENDRSWLAAMVPAAR